MICFNLTGYIIYALITSISPGPNNFLLFSHCKAYGFNDVKDIMFGIFCGFVVILYTAGYGIAEIIAHNSTVGYLLKIISSIWLLYLGFLLRNLNAEFKNQTASKIGFSKAFLMQFINPKAWIMAIGGAAAFLPHYENIHLSVFVFTFIFVLIGVPCMFAWVGFGEFISRLLKTQKSNRIMGNILFGLMLISILMIWL